MQVDPIKPKFKPPGITRLKHKSDQPLSSFGFEFKLRRYTMGTTESLPGDGECQRLMSGAKSLVYYGHGRFLSYVPPSAVACVDLSHCAVALLACNTNNVEAQRRQVFTLVHFSAQRQHFLWDTLGTFSRWMGHDSSQTGHKTAH